MNKEEFEKQHPGLKSEMMMEEAITSVELATDKYNQLREEIIKCCPDIMRLEFGCKMYYKNAEKNLLVENGEYIIVDNDDGFINAVCKEAGSFHCGTFDSTEKSFKEIEIIGRDITLEDCLIALRLKGRNKLLAMNGCFYTLTEDANLISSECYWIPNIPLQDQSDECKELLYQLIVKDNKIK